MKSHNTLCVNCPRLCGATREEGDFGDCNTGNNFDISSIFVHHGEEPVISGIKGICNIFFSHCNLQCVYCQNFQISRNDTQTFLLDFNTIIEKITGYLDLGVPSVGFVSPTHMAEQVRQIITSIDQTGRKPVYVWNSNGYDRVKVLKSFENSIDVYLPDFKYADAKLCATLSGVDNYPETALKSIREMVRQKGTSITLNDEGTIESGVIVRHLILPGQVSNSKECLRLLAEEISPSLYISLMSQYHPIPVINKSHPELNRTLTLDEYDEVLEEYYRLGFYRGWTQEMASESTYNPDFAGKNPFPEL